jgi:hypothetical protein
MSKVPLTSTLTSLTPILGSPRSDVDISIIDGDHISTIWV